MQYKDDLSDTNWQELNGNVTLFGTSGLATDPLPAAGMRFYRILLNQ